MSPASIAIYTTLGLALAWAILQDFALFDDMNHDPDDKEENPCNEYGEELSDRDLGRDLDYGQECEDLQW